MGSTVLEVLKRETSAEGVRAWLVGGTVRDRLLSRASPDTDVVVDADPEEVARRVGGAAGVPWFALSKEFGAYRLVDGAGYLDIAGLRGGSIETDLGLRDFTVNAMAESLTGGDLVDPYRGRHDLERGVLAPVSGSVFADDPLRLLRAGRFLHVLGLTLEAGLGDLIRREAWRLPGAAPERMFTEISLTLETGRSAAAVCLWGDLGLLEKIFPEAVDVPPNRRGEVRGHTLATLDHLDGLLERPGSLFGRAWEALESRLGQKVDGQTPRPVALRLAGLLHETSGAALCDRFNCSTALADLVRTVVSEWSVVGYLAGDDARPRDRVAFLWRAAPWEPEVLLVAAAHAMATGDQAPTSPRELMELWRRRREDGVRPLPLDGRDLMRDLDLEPGPLLGEVLWETRLAWEAGEMAEPTEALTHAGRYLEKRRGGR